LIGLVLLGDAIGFKFRTPPQRFFGSTSGARMATDLSLTKDEAELHDMKYSAYDGDRIDAYYNRHPLDVWERVIDIASPILGWYLLQKFDNVTAPFRSAEKNRVRLLQRAVDLRDAIVQGKSVTFIKSGQALALRPDIIKSPEYVAQLTTLQDEVGTFDNNVAMGMISEELGRDAHEIFEFDPPLPIASASIGQVYRAKLRATNATVAVKVQRPDAIDMVSLDMYILRGIAALIKKRRKLNTNLVGVVDEFGKQLYQELNYVQEGQNGKRFKELYGMIPDIYVPGVYFSLTSRRILTMEFVEGTKGPWTEGGEKMLTVGIQCSVLQLLGVGFFHSDPHRGNLLRTPEGKLAYLDFGMMAEVPSSKRYAMVGAVLGLVNKDISLTINSMNELEFFPADTDTNVIVGALTEALQNSTDEGESSSLNFTKLNSNLNRISDKLPFRLPPYYTLIIRSLTILEGLALFVDPNFRLIRGAYPFIARQILSEPSPEMGKLLRSILLTQDGHINWAQLEQFVSISSKADAAMGGDFKALQGAQARSDIGKIYQNKAEGEDLTLDVASQILDYLLSDRGAFLREPLVTDVADALDALGLTAQSLLSLATNRLVPAPSQKPDRAKVEQVLKLLENISGSIPRSPSEGGPQEVAQQIIGVSTSLGSLLQSVAGDSEDTQRYRLLLRKLSVLSLQVVGKFVERRARESTRQLLSKDRIESSLPAIARVLDFLPRRTGVK